MDPVTRRTFIKGVIAAGAEARSGGFDHLGIGFNWAYQLGRSERAFFSSLRATAESRPRSLGPHLFRLQLSPGRSRVVGCHSAAPFRSRVADT